MPYTLREDFDALWRYNAIPKDLPDYVIQNLNPALPLRYYQNRALSRLFFYLTGFQDRAHPSQLLSHMATGSGKTLVMAAVILYLYEQGYRNFLFFVNQTNIIEKTRANFLNPLSSKYLFAEKIKFGAKEVRLREVSNFQSTHPDDISILFTTIQGLHSRLNTPRENALTYEDFADQNIVLISDEAHHINAETRSRKELGQDELLELDTWEATVRKIFNARPENILLEFTATVELDNPNIAAKYADKILYQYDLKEFREDGYSKEVKVLAADLPPMERALQAVVLSQYRRKVAEKHGVALKPVLLMKSRTIKESQAHEQEFKAVIRELDADRLERLKSGANGIVRKALAYFEAQNIPLEDLASELRQEFDENRILIVNSKEESEKKQLLVNSLEDKDNEIRVVFTVNMLNEGWDVLNLFDIVRLYDTRDAKKGVPGRTTMSEAQLIGRGARYFPFQLESSQIRDQRKFDDDIESELRTLEELYYHSAHNPRYIDELHKALVQTGILAPRTKTITMRVKDEFKATDFWKNGVIFVNKRIRNEREDIFGFGSVAITKRHRYQLQTGFAQEALILEDQPTPMSLRAADGFPAAQQSPSDGQNAVNFEIASSHKPLLATTPSSREIITLPLNLRDFDLNVIRTALQRLEFFQFSNLKVYFPHLKSIQEFITSADFLGDVVIDVIGAQEQIENLTQEQKLRMAVFVLEKIGKEIQTGTPDYKGTKAFEPIGINYCVKDKTLQITVNEGGDQERGVGMRETTNGALSLDLRDKAWYVYDENYGTSEEKYFVRFLHGMMSRLQERYSEIYLIRNEKLFKIHRFSDGAVVEPDFVLFLVEKDTKKSLIYQLFIEPKGQQLIATDQWKQNFLLEIEKEHKIEVFFENKDFRLVGLPFYNETTTKLEFEEKFNAFCFR